MVVAAITHVSERVLAIQRVDDDAWLLPGGPVASYEDAEVRLRQYVRDATGFEVRHLTSLGCHREADGVVEFVRCEIRGVGPDITLRPRTMRWMDRDAIAAHMDPVAARGMLDALEADRGTPIDVPSGDAPTLHAG
jgi:ADP-ribose pyrophosphatase YjhB (NUDIX family)